MNLGDARTRTRFFINEPSAASWTNAQIDSLLVAANRKVYNDICARTVDYFHKEVRILYPTSSPHITLDTVTDLITTPSLVGRWVKVLGIFEINSDADISDNNTPDLLPVEEHIVDLYNLPHSGIEEDPYNQAGSSAGHSYKILGRRLFVYPLYTTAQHLWIHMLPPVHDPAADAELLLSIDGGTTGELLDHHDLIPMWAAVEAMLSVKADASEHEKLYWARFRTMIDILGLTQQGQTPPRVSNAHR